MYVPDKGDVVWFNFDPSSGKEIMKHRPAIVISRMIFNEHTGFVIVAPITSTARGMKLEVVLPKTARTQGAILIHQIKSLDFKDREAEFIEKAPASVIAKVTELAMAIIQ
ncbi:MAG TPA: type II toxin-antitoxin system PemK/MazF family toxin [Chromatiaceae bacterium]|nr:type II toxin-antitoxin system PemK/MazF family toxin [Chromatiaceae bacterium]